MIVGGIPHFGLYFITLIMHGLFAAIAMKYGARILNGSSVRTRLKPQLRYLWPYISGALLVTLVAGLVVEAFLRGDAGYHVMLLLFYIPATTLIANLVLAEKPDTPVSSLARILNPIGLSISSNAVAALLLYVLLLR